MRGHGWGCPELHVLFLAANLISIFLALAAAII
jgi:hypothetical protein